MLRKPTLVLVLLCGMAVALAAAEGEGSGGEGGATRSKRYAYGNYDMGGDDWWYAGRLFGIIVGIGLLLACCLLPCCCLVGVWFLGWFGFQRSKQRKADKRSAQETVIIPPQPSHFRVAPHDSPAARRETSAEWAEPRGAEREWVEPSHVRDERDRVIYQAEDRYYNSSSSPGERQTVDYNRTTSRF